MAEESSASSSDTNFYEDYCQNCYPLSLVRGATSVPEGAANYLFLFEFACDFFGSCRVREESLLASCSLGCQSQEIQRVDDPGMSTIV